MDFAQQEPQAAASLPPGSVVAVLVEQHAQIRDLLAQVRTSQGEARKKSFDLLRRLLAIHEVGEEIVVRPTAKRVVGEQEAAERNAEEKEAATVLAELEKMDVEDVAFAEKFAAFERDVSEHAAREEREEFPGLLAGCDAETQQKLGRRLLAAQDAAPTHPHPATAGTSAAAQIVTGPYIALLDKARDRFGHDES